MLAKPVESGLIMLFDYELLMSKQNPAPAWRIGTTLYVARWSSSHEILSDCHSGGGLGELALLLDPRLHIQ